MTAERLVVRVRRQDRSAARIHFGDDMQMIVVAGRSERPLVVREDAERSGAIAVVGNCQ